MQKSKQGKNPVGEGQKVIEAVYDIVDCGPRKRFWANGKLVHNSNWQNFKRGSDIRRAIMAPEGYLLAAIDLSQIECRILNYLAGQNDVIEKFRKNEDPYIGIASQFYGRTITKKDVDERGTGKQAELSCGYGCGAQKFKATARLGIYGPPVNLSDADAKRFVDLYRNTHSAVTAYWRQAETLLGTLAAEGTCTWGPMKIGLRKIFLPNGAPLNYDTLEWHVDSETGECYWRLRTRNGWSKMYGAKLVENVVQALARVVLSQAMIRVEKMGYKIVNTTHDEILILVGKNSLAEKAVAIAAEEMKRPPAWLPGIPLDVDWKDSIGERYSK